MIASMMQPYFFPYIGYFQLMASSDVFVIRDDVQYIRNGWVNRNRILVNGRPRWITLPVLKADHKLAIGSRKYLLNDRLARSVRSRILGAYHSAPYFDATLAVVDKALNCGDANVARFNAHALECVAVHLGIETPLRLASSIPRHESARGQDGVIEICAQLGASGYINPIGGRDLYDAASFAHRGLTLQFLRSSLHHYPQFGEFHVPSLSVIDVMMFNSLDAIKGMLRAYQLTASGPSALSDDAAAARPFWRRISIR